MENSWQIEVRFPGHYVLGVVDLMGTAGGNNRAVQTCISHSNGLALHRYVTVRPGNTRPRHSANGCSRVWMSRQTDRWYWVWAPICVPIFYARKHSWKVWSQGNIPDTSGNIPQLEESIPFHITSQESFPDFTRNDSFCKEWQFDQKEWFLCQKGMIIFFSKNNQKNDSF